MNEVTKDQAVSWGVRAAVVAAGVAVLAVVLPVAILAVKAGMALAALGVLAVVGIGAAQVLPLLGQKWENKVLSMRKSEARQNPIEQLQNFFNEKRQSVNKFKAAVAQINVQIRGLSDMLIQRKKDKPNADTSRQESSLQSMVKAHQVLVIKYQNAEKALVELQEVIEDRKFEWNFAKAGQSAISTLNATSGEDLVNLMLADEAHSAVLNNFNSVFADLDMEAAKLSTQNQMDFGNGLVLDVSAIQLVDKVPSRKDMNHVLA